MIINNESGTEVESAILIKDGGFAGYFRVIYVDGTRQILTPKEFDEMVTILTDVGEEE